MWKVAEPWINVPSRTYFSQSVIPAKYVELQEEVEIFLSTVQLCSITTDLWTATYQTRGYIGSTCHAADSDWTLRSITLSTIELTANLTAPTISSALMELMTQWGIKIRLLEAQLIMPETFLMLWNFVTSSTLQLSVLKTFDLCMVTKILAKKASRNLCEKQKQLGIPMYKLLNDLCY